MPVPPPETIRGARPSAPSRSTSADERLQQLARARAPELVVDRVLVVADVALETGVLEPVGVRHEPRERNRALHVGEAGAAATDLDVDEHLERAARASPGRGELGDVARVVGDDDQVRRRAH